MFDFQVATKQGQKKSVPPKSFTRSPGSECRNSFRIVLPLTSGTGTKRNLIFKFARNTCARALPARALGALEYTSHIISQITCARMYTAGFSQSSSRIRGPACGEDPSECDYDISCSGGPCQAPGGVPPCGNNLGWWRLFPRRWRVWADGTHHKKKIHSNNSVY